MTKVFIFLLDKFVWMLLITVITTQALQFVGVVPSPKGLEDITYNKDNNYEFQLGVGDSEVRGKRQTDEQGSLIDNIFNIPIATLNAVSNLLQNNRERRLQRQRHRQEVESIAEDVNDNNKRTQRHARDDIFSGPKVQLDGSSSKVLLNLR